ncbi:MAG: hypothetical protein Q9195_001281 [Heterodermia aff. obscurata]
MSGRHRKTAQGPAGHDMEDIEMSTSPGQSQQKEHKKFGFHLPHYEHNGYNHDGESGRRGIHPWHFLRIGFRSTSTASMLVNALWPFVPPAIALHFARPDLHVWIFALNYIAMIPSANLIGFAGQELARKLPKVFGVVLETFLGGIVEIILFTILIVKSAESPDPKETLPGTSNVPIIRAAILGSILANLLLCLGFCFFVGGMNKDEQVFDEAVSEVGSGLLLVAGFGLLIPSAFFNSLYGGITGGDYTRADLENRALTISRATSVILMVAFGIYVFFQMRTHHGIYEAVLEEDEKRDHDRHKDLKKDKFTFTECIVAIMIALTFVTLSADFLVHEIEFIVEDNGVSDLFMGLILVPLVEKVAEHLTAIDEAHDNQDLNFEPFNIIVLILSIIVVGNFLRDKKSNYLEGSLCILVYLIIAVAAFYYPNPKHMEPGSSEGSSEGGAEGGEATSAAEIAATATQHATEAALRFFRG